MIRKCDPLYKVMIQSVLFLPSTREVSNVTFAALRLPAGNAIPILSSLSRKFRPPSFDLALKKLENSRFRIKIA